MEKQKCPICGNDLQKKIGTERFEYKGKEIFIPDYVAYECSDCGEAIVDPETLKKSGKMLKEFQRQVDGLLTGQQIKTIRKKLGLTQEQMAEIVGGGLKSFARYESGKICQSKGMDNLLRILDAYPEMLNVIRKKEEPVRGVATVTYFAEVKSKKAYQLQDGVFNANLDEVIYGT